MLSPLAPLAATRRFPFAVPHEKVQSWELGALLSLGVVTGLLLSYVKLRLGIPGHSIVLAVAPLGLGLAIVPRRWAGITMSGAAAGTMLIAQHTGAGAMTSMLVTGLMLDLALRNARAGFRLYAAFILAGLGGNAAAYIARAAAKVGGVEPGAVLFTSWWSHALIPYAVSGAIAGLLSAAMWFSLDSRKRNA